MSVFKRLRAVLAVKIAAALGVPVRIRDNFYDVKMGCTTGRKPDSFDPHDYPDMYGPVAD